MDLLPSSTYDKKHTYSSTACRPVGTQTRDWANVGRSQADIETAEAAWVRSLKPGGEISTRPAAKRNCRFDFPRSVLRFVRAFPTIVLGESGTEMMRYAAVMQLIIRFTNEYARQ